VCGQRRPKFLLIEIAGGIRYDAAGLWRRQALLGNKRGHGAALNPSVTTPILDRGDVFRFLLTQVLVARPDSSKLGQFVGSIAGSFTIEDGRQHGRARAAFLGCRRRQTEFLPR